MITKITNMATTAALLPPSLSLPMKSILLLTQDSLFGGVVTVSEKVRSKN
jgi:hypothetical protein